MDHVLTRVSSHPGFHLKPVGVKLAPYFDSSHFDKVVDILIKHPIKYVVCINTIGNALFVDSENECAMIAPREGLGGLGGGFVKPTALANVYKISRLLIEKGRSDIDVVGVGGIFTGKDAFEMILCGASAVQVKILPFFHIAIIDAHRFCHFFFSLSFKDWDVPLDRRTFML
jgi:dihydroorotate dehydrogenase